MFVRSGCLWCGPPPRRTRPRLAELQFTPDKTGPFLHRGQHEVNLNYVEVLL